MFDHDPTDPHEVGLNADRLAAMPAYFKENYIDTGKLPCMGLLVSRGGEIAHESYTGSTEMGGKEAISTETIFRIYSMTKPITTLAIMMLLEECKIRLDHPVSRYIPEYKNAMVWDGGTAAAPKLRKPDREMTVLDLVTHTSGLTYGFLMQDETDEIYRREKVGHPKDTLQDMARQIGQLPLAFSPGTEWRYSHSIDVLGALVEIISGQPLDEFFRERIFGPLGMDDTDFWVPPEKIHRLMACYQKDAKTGETTLADPGGAASKLYAKRPNLLNAGGGLASTIRDYHRFALMLLRGGTLDGARLISPKTWEFMRQNHLPDGQTMRGMGRSAFTEVMADGVGFGLGGSVVQDIVQTRQPGSNGTFSWGGLASTFFWIDPEEELIAIQATQLMPSSTYPMRMQYQQLVYAAIDW
ncbi:MAG: beta-lactamase family protein [Hyphomonas sp.]|uniref:serine hydrolase domain-containing protein n=1 Tax=Hyphomonas sp. TaxID=87 RepID=UPI00185B1071|nr:serine hydrolase domain-containing protein [Hyphomonas sp.]MBA3067044.1 beta-lactamase family protein [Hyphomonas sp.]MBU3921652.1 beta-lactamase family protein [Alphaproteobacteria bacterium]MBU4063161.1 beta-lactamase family protein [Alphaproteobacteria bacterium]MBU4164478.1 beta-lactamase family protein [Alphaproteobacteria bacterium]